MINPELRQFEEQSNNKGKEKEIVGTTTTSSKVLSSGKVLGKPITNQVKYEWMQVRKNKYQRDNRGHIIDNLKEKEASNVKGKTKVDALATKNKFDALEVEEIDQPTLRITGSKGNDKVNEKKKKQGDNEAKKVREKEQVHKVGSSSPNTKSNGIRLAEKGGVPNPTG